MHTAVNARRYLLGLCGISPQTKLLGLLSWNRDPEIHFANVDIRCVPERTPFSRVPTPRLSRRCPRAARTSC